ncbi:MAG: hypothetical protein LC799_08125, partial [Actinobacteria bacterium]|nr:hypothetical protein [Actinomycetota bacterium]
MPTGARDIDDRVPTGAGEVLPDRTGSDSGDREAVPAGAGGGDPGVVADGQRPTPARPENPAPEPGIPPSGVAAQLDYFVGGDSPCFRTGDAPSSRPTIVFNTDEAQNVFEVPSLLEICFVGFPSPPEGEPLVVRITSPRGDVVHSRTFAAQEFEWTESGPVLFYGPIPGHEKGEYIVTATQGSTVVSQGFEVVPAGTPTIMGMYGIYYDNAPNLPG